MPRVGTVALAAATTCCNLHQRLVTFVTCTGQCRLAVLELMPANFDARYPSTGQPFIGSELTVDFWTLKLEYNVTSSGHHITVTYSSSNPASST
jgi:hypothetical protein